LWATERSFYPFPYDAAGGNIAPFFAVHEIDAFGNPSGFSVRARRFPVPGTYHYHSERYHTSGTILVRPWSS